MIRGYTAVIDRHSPLPDMQAAYAVCRKAAVKLSALYVLDGSEGITDFVFSIQNTAYSFKVFQNIRMADKSNIDSGLVRIGFIEPELDVVISCTNNTELKVFIDTVEIVHQTPPRIKGRHCCDLSPPGKKYVYRGKPCEFCIVSGSSTFPDCSLGTLTLSVTSYPYVTSIIATRCNLTNIAESLGSLPCLEFLCLSHNRLGENENWKFLTSPFIRENLNELYLDHNGIRRFPDVFLELKNVHTIGLSDNSLKELPDALGNLKKLSYLNICNNQLSVLPSCLYLMNLLIGANGNPFSAAYMRNNKPQLKPEDFTKINVPSLFHTVAASILSSGLGFLSGSTIYRPNWLTTCSLRIAVAVAPLCSLTPLCKRFAVGFHKD